MGKFARTVHLAEELDDRVIDISNKTGIAVSVILRVCVEIVINDGAAAAQLYLRLGEIKPSSDGEPIRL